MATIVELPIHSFEGLVDPDWCPGCGDFGVLKSVKMAAAKAGVAPKDLVIVSGIGCSSNLPGYVQQTCPPRNPERARALLAEAGYPDGRGFPKLEIHYNTEQGHQSIAELARKQWQRELGINVSLRNEEWASAQDTQQQMNYMLSRRSWSGDYIDPNTFLDMYLTGGENNSTGFTSAEYDRLIADAAREPDENKRMRMLERAERILMDEMPIIPIYYYVSKNLVKPHVRGWYNTLQDVHPLNTIWIDDTVDPYDPRPNEYMGRKP